MSEYAVHFTKSRDAERAYWTMTKILSSGELLPSGPFGAAAHLDPLQASQRSVCFSEIPLGQIERLVQQRSSFGIGFRKEYLVEAGGGRVWYLDNNGEPAAAIQKMVAERAATDLDVTDDLWRLTPFIDPPTADQWFQFDWEREWRVPSVLRFSPGDVAFLFIPEDLHSRALEFFTLHGDLNTGPAYVCPYVDPTWSDERLQEHLAEMET